VLALRYFGDLSDDEIASTLGVRPATVRTRVHRALAHVRKEIER
jgi:DNA-directed RNA polymerase specialized sigma24 family protein